MPNFRMRYVLVALVPLAVAGCVSSKEQRAMDRDTCSSYGYRPKTDAFADCMMEQNTRRADDEQRYLDRMHAQERRDKERKKARRQRDDSYIDPRPSYDRDGNPNFDTKGNYQGCHGIGCEVDNPDDD
ncbi:hypothetical protein ABMA46_12140 [Mesorhizobium sp. CN5-321]|jgi:hypothetical protein|uniref:hypothetical protein n=1 Tax=Mesorhizobium hunchu TaxID=3157708 RepID=UPI0032B7444A